MIVNFITDEYLEKFFPDIINFRAGGQNDYSNQITAATEHLLDDLIARNITPRNCMVPLDLCRSGSGGIQQLTLLDSTDLTFTADKYYSKMYQGKNQRRAYFSVTEKTASDNWTWVLVGSNAKSLTDASDDTCEDILNFDYGVNDSASTKNQTFLQEYKWYGFRLERVIGAGSFKFRAGIFETVYDRLIAYKALELIAYSWKTGQNQKWDDRKDDMRKEYEDLLDTVRISIDADEDGVPEESEAGKKVGGSLGSISIVS